MEAVGDSVAREDDGALGGARQLAQRRVPLAQLRDGWLRLQQLNHRLHLTLGRSRAEAREGGLELVHHGGAALELGGWQAVDATPQEEPCCASSSSDRSASGALPMRRGLQ